MKTNGRRLISNFHDNQHWLAAGTPWFAQSLQCAELGCHLIILPCITSRLSQVMPHQRETNKLDSRQRRTMCSHVDIDTVQIQCRYSVDTALDICCTGNFTTLCAGSAWASTPALLHTLQLCLDQHWSLCHDRRGGKYCQIHLRQIFRYSSHPSYLFKHYGSKSDIIYEKKKEESKLKYQDSTQYVSKYFHQMENSNQGTKCCRSQLTKNYGKVFLKL